MSEWFFIVTGVLIGVPAIILVGVVLTDTLERRYWGRLDATLATLASRAILGPPPTEGELSPLLRQLTLKRYIHGPPDRRFLIELILGVVKGGSPANNMKQCISALSESSDWANAKDYPFTNPGFYNGKQLTFRNRAKIVRFDARPNTAHNGGKHDGEDQLSYVHKGWVRYTLKPSNEQRDTRAGECVCIPAGIEHDTVTIEESEIYDMFVPRR